MDYTSISARHVLASFGFTFLVAVLPVLFAFFKSGSAQRLLLGLGPDIVLVSIGAGLLWLAVRVGRKVVRRPFRA